MNQCCLYRSCAVGSVLEHSPVTRAAGDRNPVEAWNSRIIYVNARMRSMGRDNLGLGFDSCVRLQFIEY